jgi:hypothetical protein
MLNLFQYHSRHAEFISVSALCVVKDEILKQVQDDGVWLYTDDVLIHSDRAWVHTNGVWIHAEFISVSAL